MTLLEDVETLKKSPLPEVRETIANKICDYFNKDTFEGEEYKIACDILRLFAKDIEIRVRIALSQSLKNNPKIPHDIALRLASDEMEVAVPILQFSKVITEGDILEIIVSTNSVGKLIAISKRDDVSKSVSSALVLKREEKVCSTLFSNLNAEISEETLNLAIEEFARNGDIVNSLLNRGDLPIGIIEKMISLTTDNLKQKIQEHLQGDNKTADTLVDEVRERATLGLLDEKPINKPLNRVQDESDKAQKAEQLARHLYSQKRLSSSIILRSICEGNIDFFEASLSVSSRIPLVNVRALVRSGEKQALCSLFQRAEFPLSSVDAIVVILKFIKKENYAAKIFDKNTKRRLIEYIEANNYDSNTPLMPYIMALISSDITIDNITN
jgi:uncharacterized protein (DUF2336 family)